MLKYVLGIDFGGGASKATLLDENGLVAAVNTVEYPTLYPQSGYTEQNPQDWFDAAAENIKEVISKSGICAENIIAVSLDAATHTAVLCDESFNVLMPSIYWTDTRSTKQVDYLRREYAQVIENQTLHKPDTIWTLPQLMWVKENQPEVFARTKKIMFAKDYVRHCLTGDFVTDYIEAQGSMFFDIPQKKWSDELCAIVGISKDMLPDIVSPTDIVGTVTKEAAALTGLCQGTRVLCGTTDTVMEVFAAGAIEKSDITVKLATAGRICVITDKAYPDRHFVNYNHIVDGLWYPGTATKSCAASLRWYRDTFGGDYRALDTDAESIAIGCDGLMFHPYLSGELTPYADPSLCASFIGIRAAHTKAHFTRAVMEGVALSLFECKQTIDAKHISYKSNAVIIGGGAKSLLWRRIVSDTLGLTLTEKNNSDSSLGSAMLAGVSCGVFENLRDALGKCTTKVSVTQPNTENHEKYLKLHEKYKTVHDALAPIYSGEAK